MLKERAQIDISEATVMRLDGDKLQVPREIGVAYGVHPKTGEQCVVMYFKGRGPDQEIAFAMDFEEARDVGASMAVMQPNVIAEQKLKAANEAEKAQDGDAPRKAGSDEIADKLLDLMVATMPPERKEKLRVLLNNRE